MSKSRLSKKLFKKLGAIKLAELVAEFTEFSESTGNELKCLCPFPDHGDSAPSFNINIEKNVFFCHGCRKGGGPIEFTMNMWGLERGDAVLSLCEKYNIGPEGQTVDLGPIYDVLEVITGVYSNFLLEEQPPEVINYLKRERGLTDETIAEFRIGCTMVSDFTFRGMTEVLKGEFSEELLVQAGISTHSLHHDGVIDAFRNRIIWPITDVKGRTIALAGRDFTGTNKIKYLNSCDSPLFNKGQVLFNLHRGIEHKHEPRVIIFEDYFSVFLAWQNGITETVSLMGTAFNRYKTRLAARIARGGTIYICLDPDTAGQLSALELAVTLLNEKSKIIISEMPKDLDPDEIIRIKGSEFFEELLKEGASPEAYIKLVYDREYDYSSIADQLRARDSLGALLSKVDNSIKRMVMGNTIAEDAGISKDLPVKDLARNYILKDPVDLPLTEVETLSILVQLPELVDYHAPRIHHEGFSETGAFIFELIRTKSLDGELSDPVNSLLNFLRYEPLPEEIEEVLEENTLWLNFKAGENEIAKALETLRALDPHSGDIKRLTKEFLQLMGDKK